MHELTMPRLTDSMTEGTIVAWLAADGAEVARGDDVVDIETDKATMTVEVEADGVLRQIAAAGDVVAVGEPIATVAAPGAGGDERPVPATVGAEAAADPPVSAGAGGAVDAPPRRRRGKGVSPIARRMARRLGVDLDSVAGGGPGGRVMKADVAAAAAANGGSGRPAPAPAAIETAKGSVETVELTALQRTIAMRMAESKAVVPDFWASVEVDMTAATDLREQLRGRLDPLPSLTDLIVKAAAKALRRHPRANGSFVKDRFEFHGRVNVGVAVAAEDALLVPVVRDVDRLSISELAVETRRLAAAARERAITPAELDGATFTVSNLGMMGVRSFAGIVDSPRAAILCVGAVEERPIVRAGSVVAAPTATLTLVSDHRILYGSDAAAFLADLRELLEQPLAALL